MQSTGHLINAVALFHKKRVPQRYNGFQKLTQNMPLVKFFLHENISKKCSVSALGFSI